MAHGGGADGSGVLRRRRAGAIAGTLQLWHTAEVQMGKAFFVATVAVGLHRLVAVPGRTVERACPWEHLPAPTPGGVHAFGLYTLFLGVQ